MNQEVMIKAYDLVDEIKSSDAYQEYIKLENDIANNKDIQETVAQFQKAKSAYEEAKQYGKHHPDLKSRQRTLADVKKNLYSYSSVARYKQLEIKLQKQLDRISKTIANAISLHIPHPNELGILQVEKGENSCSNESV
ncbi:MAG: YlbF family regulator [Candidatus Izemoplasma sp.]|nr:YlbF family regulator [Candidatus Izemoplasma sp.]